MHLMHQTLTRVEICSFTLQEIGGSNPATRKLLGKGFSQDSSLVTA